MGTPSALPRGAPLLLARSGAGRVSPCGRSAPPTTSAKADPHAARWRVGPRRSWSDFPMPEAADEMIVDHADGLHVRVDDRGTDEREPTALEILAHGVGNGGRSRDLANGSPAVPDRPAVDEAPLVRVEAAELRL